MILLQIITFYLLGVLFAIVRLATEMQCKNPQLDSLTCIMQVIKTKETYQYTLQSWFYLIK